MESNLAKVILFKRYETEFTAKLIEERNLRKVTHFFNE